MCLSKAYLLKDEERELVLEEVSSVKSEGDKLLLKTLFGEQKEIKAEIKEIDFMTHNILLAEPV
jgi:predicted RNA-binding protein